MLSFIFWLNASISRERHVFSHIAEGWTLFVVTEMESWITETLNLFRELEFLFAINASHAIESQVSLSLSKLCVFISSVIDDDVEREPFLSQLGEL